MKEKYGFIEFENISEFRNWFNDLKITRKIDGLQVHHMDLPSYDTWKNTDCKLWGEKNAPLNRTKSLDEYGKATWNYGDGHGHYIAQHLNVFPNGHITTGRDINSTPIGIKGWNKYKICVEIYGDFDVDVMTQEQKEAVIAIYAIMANRLNIPISSQGIRPHCWFTADGTYLGGYSSSKSAKTCPGKKFFGGNTKKSFDENFYPLIKNYKYIEKQKYLRVLKAVNVHSSADFKESSVCGKVEPGTVLTIIDKVERSGTDMYLVKAGYYITASTKYVEVFEK